MSSNRHWAYVLGFALVSIGGLFALVIDRGILGPDAETLALAVGVAATVLGTLASSYPRERSATGPNSERPHLEARLAQIRNDIDRTRVREQTARLANSSFAAANYVVGAVLATSFVQQSVSPTAAGFFGVVVVAASGLHQVFRPDLLYLKAKSRRIHLQKVLRYAEDEIFAASEGSHGAPSSYKVARLLSRILNEVDAAELDDPEVDAEEKPD